jgi:hypothetical protein
MTVDPLLPAELAFRELLKHPRAYALWATEARRQWQADSQARLHTKKANA